MEASGPHRVLLYVDLAVVELAASFRGLLDLHGGEREPQYRVHALEILGVLQSCPARAGVGAGKAVQHSAVGRTIIFCWRAWIRALTVSRIQRYSRVVQLLALSHVLEFVEFLPVGVDGGLVLR